jgi:hypothetical protein
MILNNTDKLVVLFSFGLGLIVYSYSKSKHSSLPLPPGPKKLPFLGNLFDLPTSQEWLKYAEWCKQFSTYPSFCQTCESLDQSLILDSNIVHVYAVGYDIIILNSFDAAIELCDKRSSIYSSRCVSIIPSTRERCRISIFFVLFERPIFPMLCEL